jgi:hypothetical protein
MLTPPVDPPKQFTFEIIPELLTGLGADTTYAPFTEHPEILSITLTVYVPTPNPKLLAVLFPFDQLME